jgi:hypothetical protein
VSDNTHAVIYESREARCCHAHREQWAVCSCGWEAGDRLTRDIGTAVMAHRLAVIEKAIGIHFTFGAKP